MISGTSAGGINGVFLAKAIAHDLSQQSLRDLWFAEADIGKLLAGPLLPAPKAKLAWFAVRALARGLRVAPPLRGDRMCRLLYGALSAMPPDSAWRRQSRPGGPTGRGCCRRPVSLELFVTMTDARGHRRYLPIGNRRLGGEPLVVSDLTHRHVVRFALDPSRGEDHFAGGADEWPGQHEINFRFADALTMADNHAIYKNGAKEIANLNGCSITFMAKPFESWIGNSCHIHASLFRDGEPAFRDDQVLFDRFLAGMIACFKELAIFLAPTINSYKRYSAGSWAPTTLAWGNDNRTCGFRLVGHGASRRVETRIPGGDVNPYLAFAAMIAAGLHGIENELELPPALEGNAYESDAERFPSSLREAILALEIGTIARGAFGDQVVDHYLNYARRSRRSSTRSSPTGSGCGSSSAGESRPHLGGRSRRSRVSPRCSAREGHEPVALLCVPAVTPSGTRR